jgi:hypothetical protein
MTDGSLESAERLLSEATGTAKRRVLEREMEENFGEKLAMSVFSQTCNKT